MIPPERCNVQRLPKFPRPYEAWASLRRVGNPDLVTLLINHFPKAYQGERFDKFRGGLQGHPSRVPRVSGYPPQRHQQGALEILLSHAWPGNVRELINVIDYAFVLCPEGVILPDHLPAQVLGKPDIRPRRLRSETTAPYPDERRRLTAAITEAGGKLGDAARNLGISRVTLWKRLKAYDIRVDKTIRE